MGQGRRGFVLTWVTAALVVGEACLRVVCDVLSCLYAFVFERN